VPLIEIRPHAIYTLGELCLILKVSEPTVRRWLKVRNVKSGKIGRRYLVLGSQLLNALDPILMPQTDAQTDAQRDELPRTPVDLAGQ
jgi:excisionase family DNA binding protein